jgi:hypothetical protein
VARFTVVRHHSRYGQNHEDLDFRSLFSDGGFYCIIYFRLIEEDCKNAALP